MMKGGASLKIVQEQLRHADPMTTALIVDPFFGGRVLDEVSVLRLLRRALGPKEALRPEHLAAAPARTVSLIISDVPGDDLSIIASGPTVPDVTTSAEALAILRRYAIAAPAAVIAHLERAESETPKPGDPRLAAVANILIATPQMSLALHTDFVRSDERLS